MPTQEDNFVRPDIIVNEKSSAFFTLTFLDENGAQTVPGSADWSLYDRASGSTLNSRSFVNISSLAATVTIELTVADNAMADQNRRQEQHILYIRFFYGSGNSKKGTVRILFVVENEKLET